MSVAAAVLAIQIERKKTVHQQADGHTLITDGCTDIYTDVEMMYPSKEPEKEKAKRTLCNFKIESAKKKKKSIFRFN